MPSPSIMRRSRCAGIPRKNFKSRVCTMKLMPRSPLGINDAGTGTHTISGPHFRGLMLYLSNQPLLPFERLRQVCKALFGQPLSMGTLTSINARASEALAPVERAIIHAHRYYRAIIAKGRKAHPRRKLFMPTLPESGQTT